MTDRPFAGVAVRCFEPFSGPIELGEDLVSEWLDHRGRGGDNYQLVPDFRAEIRPEWSPNFGDSERLALVCELGQMAQILKDAQPFLRRAREQRAFSTVGVINKALGNLSECVKLICEAENKGLPLTGPVADKVRDEYRKDFVDVVVNNWPSFRKYELQVQRLLRTASGY